MTTLTEEEQAAIELANYTQRAKLSFMSMVQARQLARALLSLHGKLEKAEASEKNANDENEYCNALRSALADASATISQAEAAYQRLCDSLEVAGSERDEVRKLLGIARKAFTEWRDNPSDLADYELRRALARIAEPAPKEKV